MNCYQTLAANTALMSIGTFGSKLLVFLMVRFYTGYLTPAEYGTADLITQTANLLIPLVSLDITDGVFRFAADRNSGRADVFFGWFSHYNARLAADAGGSGACKGYPGRSQLRTSACDICYCVLLSCALRPLCSCKGKYRAVCRAGPFQHGAVYRTEHSVFIGV